jgi:hypothetical protein
MPKIFVAIGILVFDFALFIGERTIFTNMSPFSGHMRWEFDGFIVI